LHCGCCKPIVRFLKSITLNTLANHFTSRWLIEGFRSLAGATDPTVAAPGTIRGDLARDQGTKVVQNIVHGSDSVESANREIDIFFKGFPIERNT
jgi:nucleoside-diphosphate kinase